VGKYYENKNSNERETLIGVSLPESHGS